MYDVQHGHACLLTNLWFACREYADFRVSSDGEVQGVGLLIAQEPSSGRLVVLAPIRGGPADKAGVLPGDEVSALHFTSSHTFGLCYPLLLVLSCSHVMRHAALSLALRC